MGIYLNCKNTGQNSKYANHIDIYNNRNGFIVSIILNTLYTILSKIESKIFYKIGIPYIIKSPPGRIPSYPNCYSNFTMAAGTDTIYY